MQTRQVFLLCLTLCLIIVLWMFVVSPGANTVSAQGPVSTEGDRSGPKPPKTPLTDVGAPDSRNSATQSPQSPNATFSYYFVSGATLMPRDSGTGRNDGNSGCAYTVGGADRFMNTELHLPDGSIVKYLRLFTLDNDTTYNVSGYITRYNVGTSTDDLVSVSSSGSGGLGSWLSPEITHTVDNFGYAYVLIGWPGTSSSTVQLCGLRVAYYAPSIFGAFMPLIVK